ncbi:MULTISPECIES: hypothetical protein [unclassified Sphingomonas]|uniref:hypothetical protein n=1 Tax=unclassified Sphingomonas TaxID=196159 RepID=UPI0008348680|nr:MULTISPECIES: hypothetical protein [unclassified Sphingomonas]
MRVSVKLSDAIARKQVGAERFEDDLARVFDLQDRVAGQVAQRVDSSIEREEMRRAMSRPVSSPNAYHLYWRANALFWNRDLPPRIG